MFLATVMSTLIFFSMIQLSYKSICLPIQFQNIINLQVFAKSLMRLLQCHLNKNFVFREVLNRKVSENYRRLQRYNSPLTFTTHSLHFTQISSTNRSTQIKYSHDSLCNLTIFNKVIFFYKNKKFDIFNYKRIK